MSNLVPSLELHGNVPLTCTPPHIFMTCCLIKHRGNFVFHNMMQIIRWSQFGRIGETIRKKLWQGGHCFSEQVEEGKGRERPQKKKMFTTNSIQDPQLSYLL